MVKRSQRYYDQENVKLMVDQRDYGEDNQGDGTKNQISTMDDQEDNKPRKEWKPDEAMIEAKKPNRR